MRTRYIPIKLGKKYKIALDDDLSQQFKCSHGLIVGSIPCHNGAIIELDSVYAWEGVDHYWVNLESMSVRYLFCSEWLIPANLKYFKNRQVQYGSSLDSNS